MKSKDWLIIVFCLILSGVLLTAASMRTESIHTARKKMGLVTNTSLDDSAPPSLAFATVAMGAFRGLIVDILWMRADTLKDEGIIEQGKAMGDYLKGALNGLKDKYEVIRDVRGLGLLLGMRLAIAGGPFVTQCMERGFLINCIQDNILRFDIGADCPGRFLEMGRAVGGALDNDLDFANLGKL